MTSAFVLAAEATPRTTRCCEAEHVDPATLARHCAGPGSSFKRLDDAALALADQLMPPFGARVRAQLDELKWALPEDCRYRLAEVIDLAAIALQHR